MSEHSPEQSNGRAQPSQPGKRLNWGRRIAVGALLVGLGAASGIAIGKVHSEPGLFWHGMGHHQFDPDRAATRIEHRVDRVLSRLDATKEQKDKVSGIIKTAFSDIVGMGVQPWETRQKFAELLRADTIDPAALEALRAEQVTKIDAASKRMVQAMSEAATVLTPEQRRDLIDRWQKRHERGGHPEKHSDSEKHSD
jgi:protein CpxP